MTKVTKISTSALLGFNHSDFPPGSLVHTNKELLIVLYWDYNFKIATVFRFEDGAVFELHACTHKSYSKAEIEEMTFKVE